MLTNVKIRQGGRIVSVAVTIAVLLSPDGCDKATRSDLRPAHNKACASE
jgi:hypothetical protein